MTVDEFVETKVNPEYREVAARLRALMREMAPEAQEEMSYGMPVYKGKTLFAYFTASKTGITFAFTRGVEFKDRYGLLQGRGKSARHVKMKSLDSVSEPALKYYIKQALAGDVK